MRWTTVTALVLTLSTLSPCLAQSVTPEGIAAGFAQAWNAHDKAAFDNLFADDAHFIPTYDIVAEGRTDIVAGIYQGHEEGTGGFRESTLTPSKVAVQSIGPDAAVVHFNASIHLPAALGIPPLERTLLLVVVRQRDGWRIASGQLTKPNCAPN